MISSERARSILESKRNEINLILWYPSPSPEFHKWFRDTKVAIEKIFGPDHVKDFTEINFGHSDYFGSKSDQELLDEYARGMGSARAILDSLLEELATFGTDGISEHLPNPSAAIDNLCDRFHLVARQLRRRHAGRQAFEIDDEYDVQDLFHALLHLKFSDIRSEEWAPSYAGGHSRSDFLLKNEQTVIEIKKTRPGLSVRNLSDQLIVDIARYQSHPDCKKLVCFAYDPDGLIPNPRGLESDLSRQHGEIEVKVLIRPS